MLRVMSASVVSCPYPCSHLSIAAGGVFTRAEWILRGAGDMSRIDVNRGGVTGA